MPGRPQKRCGGQVTTRCGGWGREEREGEGRGSSASQTNGQLDVTGLCLAETSGTEPRRYLKKCFTQRSRRQLFSMISDIKSDGPCPNTAFGVAMGGIPPRRAEKQEKQRKRKAEEGRSERWMMRRGPRVKRCVIDHLRHSETRRIAGVTPREDGVGAPPTHLHHRRRRRRLLHRGCCSTIPLHSARFAPEHTKVFHWQI